jgi:hypothetical protein
LYVSGQLKDLNAVSPFEEGFLSSSYKILNEEEEGRKVK